MKDKFKALGEWLGSISGTIDFVKSVGLFALLWPSIAGFGIGIWQFAMSDHGPFSVLVGLAAFYLVTQIVDWMASKKSEMSFKSKVEELAESVEKLELSYFGPTEEFETKTLALEVCKRRLADTDHVSKIDPFDYMQRIPLRAQYRPSKHTDKYYSDSLEKVIRDRVEIENAIITTFKHDPLEIEKEMVRAKGNANIKCTEQSMAKDTFKYPNLNYYKQFTLQSRLLQMHHSQLERYRSYAGETIEEILANPEESA